MNFDANLVNWALSVLKHHKGIHEFCVTATAAAQTADDVNKWAKSAGQTPITNFPTCTCPFHLAQYPVSDLCTWCAIFLHGTISTISPLWRGRDDSIRRYVPPVTKHELVNHVAADMKTS